MSLPIWTPADVRVTWAPSVRYGHDVYLGPDGKRYRVVGGREEPHALIETREGIVRLRCLTQRELRALEEGAELARRKRR